MDTVDYIEFGLLYGTLVIFISRYKYLPPPFRRLIFYLLTLAIGNTTAFIMYACLHQENLFLFHFLTPIEYTALCLVFYKTLENHLIKKAVLLTVPGFILLCQVFTLFVDSLHENDSVAKVAEVLLVTTWILLYFRQLSATEKILNVKREPLFWALTGLMIYFWGTLFLQGLLNYLNQLDKALANKLYTWQYILEYGSLLAINMGVFCRMIFRRHQTA